MPFINKMHWCLPGDLVSVASLDLRKAFDTVDHSLLLDKLRNVGCDQKSLTWFSEYLSHRLQCTVANGLKSSMKTIRCGVPQGSVLVPLLFNVYINDIVNKLVNSSHYMYADDLAILVRGRDKTLVTRLLQQDLDNVYKTRFHESGAGLECRISDRSEILHFLILD